MIGMLLAILMPGLGAVAMADSAKHFQFVDEFGYPRTDATYVYVYNASTLTASTLYQGPNRQTAITNPLTPSSTNTTLLTYNGSFSFWDNKINHDIVANVGGLKVRFENVTPQDTKLQVPRSKYPSFIQKKGGYSTFGNTPVTSLLGGGAAAGTDNAVNVWSIEGVIFECLNNQTQTLIAPVMGDTGLDIMRDATENDGWELTQGITAGSKAAFTVGTDGPFHFKVKMTIADVSCSDDFAIGFRKAEAYNDAIDNYDEMAAFNLNGTGTTTEIIQTETILNNATTVTTALTTSTWTDAATHTLEVDVALDGAVTYKVDGVAPAEAVAFSFDVGEVVIPFISCLLDATPTTGIILKEWDCGYDANVATH